MAKLHKGGERGGDRGGRNRNGGNRVQNGNRDRDDRRGGGFQGKSRHDDRSKK